MMQRENWQKLNGEWLFEFDFGTSGVERGLFKPEKAKEYPKKIAVPFCPESEQKNAASNSWGYGNAPSTEEEFFTRYEGLVSALLEAPNIMGFCYTQLYDVEQEVNGLYTYSREKKFDDYSRITAANRKKAAIED